jgi:hypothetical protein
MNIDRTLGDTFYLKFTTRSFSTGAPTTLSGTPVVSAYEDGSTTEITAGITLTVDFDSRTGLNHLAIVATSGNGFEAGKDYDLVITTGTVGGVSVVGEVVGHFSLELDAAHKRIGANGAGLTAVPWNASWDAEVQSEVDDALVAFFTSAATLVDLIWDEPIAGHLSAGTAGLSEALGSAALQDTTVTGTPTSTTIELTAGSSIDDFYNDQLLYVLSGTGVGQVRTILDYNGTTNVVTVDEAFIVTPASGDRVAILVSHVHPVTQIAAEVWNDQLSDNTDAGSAGKALADNDTNIQDIQSRIPAALVSGRMSSNIAAINDVAAAAINLALSTGEIIVGAAQTGTLSSTQMTTDLTEATDNHYIGRVILWTSGVLKGQRSFITDYAGASGLLTYDVTETGEAPSNGDTFIII